MRKTPDGGRAEYFTETSSTKDERAGITSERTSTFTRGETDQGKFMGFGRLDSAEFEARLQNDEGWFDNIFCNIESSVVLQSWETDRPVDASLMQFPPGADVKKELRINTNPDLKDLREFGHSEEFWKDKDGFPTIRTTRWVIFQRESEEEDKDKLPEEGGSKKRLLGVAKTDEFQLRPGKEDVVNRKSSFKMFFPSEGGEGQGVGGNAASSSTESKGGEGTGGSTQGMRILFGDRGDEGQKDNYRFKGESTEVVYRPIGGDAGGKTEAGDKTSDATSSSSVVEGERASEKKTAESVVGKTGETSDAGKGVSVEEKNTEKLAAVNEAEETSGDSEAGKEMPAEKETAEGVGDETTETSDARGTKEEEDAPTEKGNARDAEESESKSAEGEEGEASGFVEVGEDGEKVSIEDALNMIGEGIFRLGSDKTYYEKAAEKGVQLDGRKLRKMLFEERRIPRETYQVLESLAKEGEKSGRKTTPRQKKGTKKNANNVTAASKEKRERKQKAKENKKLNPVQRELRKIWKRLGMNPDTKLAAAIEEVYELLKKEELLIFLYDGRVDPWGRRVKAASLVDVLEILVEAFRKAGSMEKFFEWVRKRTGRQIFESRVNEEFARQRLDEEILQAALEFVYETKKAINEREKLLERNTEYINKRLMKETFPTSQSDRLHKPPKLKRKIKQSDQAASMKEHTRNKRKFSNEQLIQLHQRGLSGKEAAEQLGVDISTIFKRAKKLGIRFRGNAKRKFTDKQLTKLYEQGLNTNEIAEQLGSHKYTILKYMRRLGLKTSLRKFTDEQLIQLHAKGLTAKKAAEILGVNRSIIDRHAKRLGITFRKNTNAIRKLKEEMELILLKYFKHGWFTSNDVWERYNELAGENISKRYNLKIIREIYDEGGENSILIRSGSPGNYRYRLRTEKQEDDLKDLEGVRGILKNSEEILQLLEWLLRDPVVKVSVENFETYVVSGRKLCSLIIRTLEKAESRKKPQIIIELTQLVEKTKSKGISLEELSKITEYLYPLEIDKNSKTLPSNLIPFCEWVAGELNPWPVLKLYEKAKIWETLHKIEHTLKAMGIKHLRTHNNTLLIQNPRKPLEAYEYGADITTGEWYHQPTVKTYVETEGENGLAKLIEQAVKKLEQQNKEPSYRQLAWELNSLGADLNAGIIREMWKTGRIKVSDLYALFAFLEREDVHSLKERTIEELLEKGKITKKESIILPKETLRDLNEALKKQGLGYLKKLAKATEIDPMTIGRYLRGEKKVPIENLEKICKKLELKVPYLKLHNRKSERLASWNYEKSVEVIDKNTIIERITFADPINFEERKLTLKHIREDYEVVKTVIPELNVELSPLETPWYLQSPYTFIEIDRNEPHVDNMDIIQYMLKEGKKKAGDMVKLAEILRTGPDYLFYLNSKNKIHVSTLIKLALYTNTNINEIGKYITQVGDIRGEKGKVHTTSLNSPEGALFILCIIGDGNCYKSRSKGEKTVYARFYSVEKEYIQTMQEISEKIYGFKPEPNKNESGFPVYYLVWRDSIAQTLVRAGIVPGPKNRVNTRILREIREGNKETKIMAIKGLILSEGYPGKNMIIYMTRDVPISWQETKEILQQKGLNFNTPREIEEYLKKRQKRRNNKSDDKGNLNEKHRGIIISCTQNPPKSLEKEKHNVLEDTAIMIKKLLEKEIEKINGKNEQQVKLELRQLEVRPYRITGGWELTVYSKGTGIIRKMLKSFPGYKELMYMNEVVVEYKTEVDKKLKLTPKDLKKIWSISDKRETTYDNKKCYSVSLESLPHTVKNKFKPPRKILEKQKIIAEKKAELLVDGEKVKVKGMPSIMKCEVLLFPDNKYKIRWILKRPEVKAIKNVWKRIKSVVKEKIARKESLEINIEEIMDESGKG